MSCPHGRNRRCPTCDVIEQLESNEASRRDDVAVDRLEADRRAAEALEADDTREAAAARRDEREHARAAAADAAQLAATVQAAEAASLAVEQERVDREFAAMDRAHEREVALARTEAEAAGERFDPDRWRRDQQRAHATRRAEAREATAARARSRARSEARAKFVNHGGRYLSPLPALRQRVADQETAVEQARQTWLDADRERKSTSLLQRSVRAEHKTVRDAAAAAFQAARRDLADAKADLDRFETGETPRLDALTCTVRNESGLPETVRFDADEIARENRELVDRMVAAFHDLEREWVDLLEQTVIDLCDAAPVDQGGWWMSPFSYSTSVGVRRGLDVGRAARQVIGSLGGKVDDGDFDTVAAQYVDAFLREHKPRLPYLQVETARGTETFTLQHWETPEVSRAFPCMLRSCDQWVHASLETDLDVRRYHSDRCRSVGAGR